MVDHHVGMCAHHHYREGQSSAGRFCRTVLGKALEDVKGTWGRFLVDYRIDIAPCRPTVTVNQQPCSRDDGSG